jgi:hypothetical protein
MKMRCHMCEQSIGSEGVKFHWRGDCAEIAGDFDLRGIKRGPERDLLWIAALHGRDVILPAERMALENAALVFAKSLGWISSWAQPQEKNTLPEWFKEPRNMAPHWSLTSPKKATTYEQYRSSTGANSGW